MVTCGQRRLLGAVVAVCLFSASPLFAQWPTTIQEWETWQAARPSRPVRPVFTAPASANGATGVSVTPTITWKSIGGKRSRLYLGTSSKPPLVLNTAPVFTYTPPTPLPYNTRYWMRVTTENDTGSDTSETISWTTQAQVAPTAPSLACPPAQVVTAPTNAPVVVNYPQPILTGGQTPLGAITCTPASGSLFPVGLSAVTCTVTDALNRTAQCSTSVTVNLVAPVPQESPKGWRAPRDGPTVVDASKDVWSIGQIATAPWPDGCGPGFLNPSWCREILVNGGKYPMAYGFEVLMWDRVIYLRGDDGQYYKRTATGWNGFDYFGPKGPDEIVVPPPPLIQCSDGIDNDRDGKIDMADPGCSSPTDTDETDPVASGTRIQANHDGVESEWTNNGAPTGVKAILVFDLYVDNVKVLRQTKSQAWTNNVVTMALPAATPGTHAIKMAAVYTCPAATFCAGQESLPSMSAVIAWEKP